MDGAAALLRLPARRGVVGGRAGAAEACACARVEAPAVQILVVVATIRTGTPKAGEEKGSSVQAVCRRSAGT